jgi:hypothetical protein
MNLFSKFNPRVFFIIWPIVQWVIWITFVVALANSEMDLSSNKWFNLALCLFDIFKWPTLFFYGKSYFPMFWVLIGLAINSLIYTLLLERIIALFRSILRENQEPNL